MKVFANREIRILFQAVLAVWAVALALTQGIVWHTTHVFSFGLLLVFLLLGGCLWGVLFRYFQRQSALLEQAVQQIQSCLDGNPDARLDCDREGEFYRLFHSVNALAAVLSAHADNEQREKRFFEKYHCRYFAPAQNTAGGVEYLQRSASGRSCFAIGGQRVCRPVRTGVGPHRNAGAESAQNHPAGCRFGRLGEEKRKCC